jgi:hypothetical protein
MCDVVWCCWKIKSFPRSDEVLMIQTEEEQSKANKNGYLVNLRLSCSIVVYNFCLPIVIEESWN